MFIQRKEGYDMENGGKEGLGMTWCRHFICWSEGLKGQGAPLKDTENCTSYRA